MEMIVALAVMGVVMVAVIVFAIWKKGEMGP
jgi:hypothetical protein